MENFVFSSTPISNQPNIFNSNLFFFIFSHYRGFSQLYLITIFQGVFAFNLKPCAWKFLTVKGIFVSVCHCDVEWFSSILTYGVLLFFRFRMFCELNSTIQNHTKESKADLMYVTFDRFKFYPAYNITNNWAKRIEQNTAFSEYIFILLSYVKIRLLRVHFGTQGLNTRGSNVSITG